LVEPNKPFVKRNIFALGKPMRAWRKIWLDSLQLRVTRLQFMKVLINGICGFVGNALARRIKAAKPTADVFGVDNLMRLGSEANRRLARYGIRVFHGDLRCASDVDALAAADWVIDAAANPSVLAGFDSVPARGNLPVSLYGSTKLASERLALEYGATCGFPVWINRCGVVAGAGQFGTAEQGIFSFWLHAWRARRHLRYIGFGGKGLQVRDAFHPDDLADFVLKQLEYSGSDRPLICNLAGGIRNSISLLELSDWCAARFGPRKVISDGKERPFDIPWVVLDSRRATEAWAWELNRPMRQS
jgi:nucleoside-diphosphate-sugar epimerase